MGNVMVDIKRIFTNLIEIIILLEERLLKYLQRKL